jgi:hypothetical protein
MPVGNFEMWPSLGYISRCTFGTDETATIKTAICKASNVLGEAVVLQKLGGDICLF